MPQISPMKWVILNFLTQSSIFQLISFMSMKKIFYDYKNNLFNLPTNKMSWKW